ncbi:MAG: hypothetical protein L0I76_16525 [Pseudonocardia sp.]|nr:hypothetical protein [Pseudonocardia sp.]
MVTPVRPAPATTPSGLTPGQRPEFAMACAEAVSGFGEVVDLVLVADEVTARSGPDPRVATLNRLVALRAVVAWERFVREVGALSGSGPSIEDDAGRLACLGPDGGDDGAARRVLAAASGGRLPQALSIRFPAPETNASLTFATVTGASGDLAAAVDWWVRTRHGVAHRGLGRNVAWPVRTVAHDSDGRSVDPTTARFALTMFLQLVDQSIRVIAQEAGMVREEDLWLPARWLRGEGSRTPDRQDHGAGPRLWAGETIEYTVTRTDLA